jgi:recombinational DNA repair protein (RecF pathway)
MSNTHRVLVLRKQLSGESFLKLHLLGPELGCQLCLKRVATKNHSKSAPPDLFDSAEVRLDNSRHGTARFVGEYEIIRRRSEIGLNYRTLRHASDLGNLLILNGTHIGDLPTFYQLAERSLDAFAEGREPSVVYLKCVFLLLKDEGYPVRESWWPSVPSELRALTRALLAEPSPASLAPETRASCEAATRNLLLWLRRETDLILPEGIL